MRLVARAFLPEKCHNLDVKKLIPAARESSCNLQSNIHFQNCQSFKQVSKVLFPFSPSTKWLCRPQMNLGVAIRLIIHEFLLFTTQLLWKYWLLTPLKWEAKIAQDIGKGWVCPWRWLSEFVVFQPPSSPVLSKVGPITENIRAPKRKLAPSRVLWQANIIQLEGGPKRVLKTKFFVHGNFAFKVVSKDKVGKPFVCSATYLPNSLINTFVSK